MKTFLASMMAVFALSNIAYAQIDFALDPGIIEGEVAEKIWDGNFAAGLDGKTGNSQNLDINLSLNLTRKVDLSALKLQFNYFYASNQVATSTDRFFGLARNERGFESRPKISWFSQGTVEADRFKQYDYLVGLHTGLVYKLWDDEVGFLKSRMGAGASSQVGGVSDDWIGELQFGADFERTLANGTKMYASGDYFPNINDFTDYRLITNTGVEFVISDTMDLNFRIYALYRYDSIPDPGDLENDVDYGMAIVYGF